MTALALVHGVGLDRHMWDPFIDLWDGPVLSYDLIGLGEAPKPPGPYSLGDYSDQLRSVIDTAGGGPVDVLGFSMGALVAQRFAIDHPEMVRRLVLVSGVFDRSIAHRSAILARVDDVRAGGYRAAIGPALERWFTPAFAASHPEVVEATRRRMMDNDVESYVWAYDVFATGDEQLVPLVDQIQARTLVITGSDDERSTPEMAHLLAGALPAGRDIIVPGARHLLPLEQPTALVELVRDFLGDPFLEGER